MEKPSKRFTLNRTDLNYTLERAKLFLIPLAIIYIPFVVTKISTDGFQLADFAIDEFQQGALILYILNRLLTAFQLFIDGKK